MPDAGQPPPGQPMPGTSPMLPPPPPMQHARMQRPNVLGSLLQEKQHDSPMDDRESMTDAAFGMGVGKGAGDRPLLAILRGLAKKAEVPPAGMLDPGPQGMSTLGAAIRTPSTWRSACWQPD